MSTKLPVVSGAQLQRALERAGFERRRQSSSHIVMVRGLVEVVVPAHRTVALGTLRSILRAAELSPERFRELL
jgi:predicted RNA binding protein YcfA (HicA-like mRNA interferase family)